MAGAATVAAAVLAAVLVWAAVAKLAKRTSTAAAFSALGLPGPARLAVVVPGVELAVAVVLLIRPSLGGFAALALLAAFTVVVVRALVAHVPTGCGCFGAAGGEPVSGRDLVRNGMLAALAVLATGTGRPVRPSAGALVAVLALSVAGAATLVGLRPVAGGGRR